MKTLTLLTLFLLTAACSSDPEQRDKFGDDKYHSITEDSFSMGGTSKTRIKGVTEDEATAKAWAAKTDGWCRYDYQEVVEINTLQETR